MLDKNELSYDELERKYQDLTDEVEAFLLKHHTVLIRTLGNQEFDHWMERIESKMESVSMEEAYGVSTEELDKLPPVMI